MDRTVRILLVDDEERVLDACAASLAGGPFELGTAGDGTRALALVRSFRPDLLVVDLEMPGLSGLEVLERVHAADPTIVAIVITGAATVHAAVEAMKRGADDFLAKPFTPEAFLVVVRRGAEKRALRLEAIALRRERELFLEHFAAITSHELKAPLATAQQTLLGLEREFAAVATPDQRDRFGRVQARIAELLQLIDTWLRAAVDLDAVKARFAAVPVRATVEQAIESLAAHAARKAVDVTASVPEPSPQVWGDRGTLTEVLVNVVGNAVKYSRPGGRVAVTVVEEAGAVRIAVADAGLGISAEDLPHIFDAFSSAQPGAAGERGSGLGLALSRRVVAAHGGAIAVESTPGEGSTFTITLPALRRGAPAAPRGDGPPRLAPAKEGQR